MIQKKKTTAAFINTEAQTLNITFSTCVTLVSFRKSIGLCIQRSFQLTNALYAHLTSLFAV